MADPQNPDSREPDDRSDEDARLDEVIRALDALPPERVEQALLDRGATEVALDSLRELARNSDDPEIRAEARKIIHERGLDLILWSDEEGAATRCTVSDEAPLSPASCRRRAGLLVVYTPSWWPSRLNARTGRPSLHS